MNDRYGLPPIFAFRTSGGKGCEYIIDFMDSRCRVSNGRLYPRLYIEDNPFECYDYSAKTISRYVNDGTWVITQVILADEHEFDIADYI